MDRRTFLQQAGKNILAVTAGAAYLSLLRCASGSSGEFTGKIVTVNGPISPQQMGTTLVHEHVLVDFVGADQVSRDRYDADEAFEVVLPYLQEVKELGCDALVECTPRYIGRNAALCKRLADASGVQLLTNTGYYGAADDKYVPAYAYDESADQLADRWVEEFHNGIEGTGIYPGFVKIGVDSGPLSDIDAKLVRAGAKTHKQTGLVVACHTGSGEAALGEIDIFEEEGADPSAVIWVHAQNEQNTDIHIRTAERGMWIEFDGVRPGRIQEHLEFVNAMRDAGHLNRVLLSHDAGWYSVGESGGGDFRDYNLLFTKFLPALKEAGYSDEEIQQLTVVNPREAFTVGVRM